MKKVVGTLVLLLSVHAHAETIPFNTRVTLSAAAHDFKICLKALAKKSLEYLKIDHKLNDLSQSDSRFGFVASRKYWWFLNDTYSLNLRVKESLRSPVGKVACEVDFSGGGNGLYLYNDREGHTVVSVDYIRTWADPTYLGPRDKFVFYREHKPQELRELQGK